MRTKHERTLEAILDRPTRANIRWADFVALVIALGGEVAEREGAAVAMVLNDVVGYFHRPHPRNEMPKGQVKHARDFLENALYGEP